MPTRIVLTFVLLLIASQPLVACPPPIFPDLGLFEASREAELVILARVIDINVNDLVLMIWGLTEELEWKIHSAGFDVTLPRVEPTGVIDLEVVETWKGDPRSRATFLVDGWIWGDSESSDRAEMVFFLKRDDSGAWRGIAKPIPISLSSHADDLREMIRLADVVDLMAPTGLESWRGWRLEAAARAGAREHVPALSENR